LSHLDFDIVSDLGTCPERSRRIRISSLWRTFSTKVENIRQIRLFMQNKPNFLYFSPENDDFTKKQTQFKPNSKPIKANFSPKIRVAKPIQSQNKSNFGLKIRGQSQLGRN